MDFPPNPPTALCSLKWSFGHVVFTCMCSYHRHPSKMDILASFLYSGRKLRQAAHWSSPWRPKIGVKSRPAGSGKIRLVETCSLKLDAGPEAVNTTECLRGTTTTSPDTWCFLLNRPTYCALYPKRCLWRNLAVTFAVFMKYKSSTSWRNYFIRKRQTKDSFFNYKQLSATSAEKFRAEFSILLWSFSFQGLDWMLAVRCCRIFSWAWMW